MEDFEGCAAGIFAILLIIALVMVGTAIWQSLTGWKPSACLNDADRNQACIDQRFDQCMATERYTRDECIRLVSAP